MGCESRDVAVDDDVDDVVACVADPTCAVDVPSTGSCPVAICT